MGVALLEVSATWHESTRSNFGNRGVIVTAPSIQG